MQTRISEGQATIPPVAAKELVACRGEFVSMQNAACLRPLSATFPKLDFENLAMLTFSPRQATRGFREASECLCGCPEAGSALTVSRLAMNSGPAALVPTVGQSPSVGCTIKGAALLHGSRQAGDECRASSTRNVGSVPTSCRSSNPPASCSESSQLGSVPRPPSRILRTG
jgi:hypothetical protein